MADPVRGSSSPASPGITGALKDAIAAVADAVAPRSVARRKPTMDTNQGQAEGLHDPDYLERARRGQSTDADNQ